MYKRELLESPEVAAVIELCPTPTWSTVKVSTAVPTVASKTAIHLFTTAVPKFTVMELAVEICVVTLQPQREMVTPSAAEPSESVYSEILRHRFDPPELSVHEVCCEEVPSATAVASLSVAAKTNTTLLTVRLADGTCVKEVALDCAIVYPLAVTAENAIFIVLIDKPCN